MNVTMSKFLNDKMDKLKSLTDLLSKEYEYVSVLGTDACGKRYGVQRSGISINDSMWVERGFVVRVHNGINYSEFSFNDIDSLSIEKLADNIRKKIAVPDYKSGRNKVELSSYPVIAEEAIKDEFYGQVAVLPETVDAGEKIKRMSAIMEKGLKLSDLLVDFRVGYEEVHLSKIFVSGKKELRQSYVWSQGYIIPIVRRDNDTKIYFKSCSGLKGVELLDELDEDVESSVDIAVKLLDAKPARPGEYEIICTPEISGLIAHEAFGHGVEMDMFVKKRAKALEYLGKPVASKLVTMHDGAAAARHVSSYLFDDEGTIGTDTVIIENGILKTGISDLLSAMKLGTKPTGNGKRESYERKAYARMTNTFFSSGTDKLEDMIASTKHGYMLSGTMSGMEDPKNWGIQCMLIMGREIKDGKFTGQIVSPVIMTGYVPDLLSSITMVSDDMQLEGSGACGKGHKEFAKVSDGGPYIKTVGRLG